MPVVHRAIALVEAVIMAVERDHQWMDIRGLETRADGVPASVLVHRGDGPPRPRAYTRAMRVTVAMGAFNEAPNVAIVVTDALSAIAETGGGCGGLVVVERRTDGTRALLCA